LNESEGYIKKVFNCPSDDWSHKSFEKIKREFLLLADKDMDDELNLLNIAKAYSQDAVNSYIKEKLAEDVSNLKELRPEAIRVGIGSEDFLEVADIAAMGFVLIGVFYGYLLKQKEIRDKPFHVPPFFMVDEKGEIKDGQGRNDKEDLDGNAGCDEGHK
jgi:hypothetical protein